MHPLLRSPFLETILVGGSALSLLASGSLVARMYVTWRSHKENMESQRRAHQEIMDLKNENTNLDRQRLDVELAA